MRLVDADHLKERISAGVLMDFWKQNSQKSIVQIFNEFVDLESTVTVEGHTPKRRVKVVSQILVPNNKEYLDLRGPMLSLNDRKNDRTQPCYLRKDQFGNGEWSLCRRMCFLKGNGAVINEGVLDSNIRFFPYGLDWMGGLAHDAVQPCKISEEEFFNIEVPYPVWVEKGDHGFWGLLSDGCVVCYKDDYACRIGIDDAPMFSLDVGKIPLDILLNDEYTISYDKYYTCRRDFGKRYRPDGKPVGDEPSESLVQETIKW